MAFESLHDRLAYIDAAKDWLDERFVSLPPAIATAFTEWVKFDLAGWHGGEPPSPPVADVTLRKLLGTEVIRDLFADRARV